MLSPMESAAGAAASRRLCALEEVLSVYLEPRARSYSVSRAHSQAAEFASVLQHASALGLVVFGFEYGPKISWGPDTRSEDIVSSVLTICGCKKATQKP